jgi:hypothetical protein
VLLTSNLEDADPTPAGMASAFGDVFVVAAVMVALVLVPAFFLPRKKIAHEIDPTVLVGH